MYRPYCRSFKVNQHAYCRRQCEMTNLCGFFVCTYLREILDPNLLNYEYKVGNLEIHAKKLIVCIYN